MSLAFGSASEADPSSVGGHALTGSDVLGFGEPRGPSTYLLLGIMSPWNMRPWRLCRADSCDSLGVCESKSPAMPGGLGLITMSGFMIVDDAAPRAPALLLRWPPLQQIGMWQRPAAAGLLIRRTRRVVERCWQVTIGVG